MHIVLAIIAAISAGYFLVLRARSAAEMTSDLINAAQEVKLAARRLGFRRRFDTHPVESVDQPSLAIAALAIAYAELSGLPTQEMLDRIAIELRKELGLSEDEATEHMVLGRWLTTECGTPDAAIARLSRHLYKLDGAGHWVPLLQVLKAAQARQDGPGQTGVSAQQAEALRDIQRAFHVT